MINRYEIAAPDCEEIVLGQLISAVEGRQEIFDLVKSADYFTTEKHQTVWNVCYDLYSTNQEPSAINVLVALKSSGKLDAVGGRAEIARLTTCARLDWLDSTKIVVQKYVARRLFDIGQQITQKATNDFKYDVADTIDNAQEDLYSLIMGCDQSREARHMSDIVDDVMQEIHRNHLDYQQGKTVTGLTTGFSRLNKFTNGWQKQQLIIVAARPAMGKTAFALTTAVRIAQSGKKVGIFSLEMGCSELAKRLLVAETELSMTNLERGSLEKDEWTVLNRGAMQLKRHNIWINDEPNMNPAKIRQKVRQMQRLNGLDVVIIDYLQLMHGSKPKHTASFGNRQEEVSQISRALKAIAKELDIPVIALSQLSRAVESREDKKPLMSDLRESGSIEQDADVVTFLYRPSYYGIKTNDDGDQFTETDALVIVGKNRRGATGEVKVQFRPELIRFDDIETNRFNELKDFKSAQIKDD